MIDNSLEEDVFKNRFGEKLFVAFDEFLDVFNDVFKKTPSNIIRLETNVNDSIISTRDFSMVSLFEIKGVREVTSFRDLDEIGNVLSDKLTPFFKSKGHYMQFVMEYDPSRSRSEVQKSTSILKTTSKNLKMDLDFIFDDWEDKLVDYISYEKVYVAIWTRPEALTKHNLSLAKEEQAGRRTKDIFSKNGMSNSAYLLDLLNRQKSFQQGLVSAFETVKVLVKPLGCHEALRVMRSQIDAEATSKNWRPYLNGDKMTARIKNKLDSMSDAEIALYPKIAEQIVPREFEDENLQMTRIGEKLHHPLILSVPGEPKFFDELVSALINKDFPWRLSFGLNGGGATFGIKKFLASIFKFSNPSNNLLVEAIEDLNECKKAGIPIVEFKASFDTWVNAYEENAVGKLKSQASDLMTSLQGWGSSEVSDIIGNPTLGMLSTVSGLLDYTPSEGAGMTLNETINMMPFSRPASIWKSGATPFRSGCGKMFPYQQGSDKQTAWVDIGVAPMGFGKSVTLNTLNFTFIFEPGIKNLPWLSTLDIGPSSKGMVDLIRLGLPEDQKNLAVYHRLKMSTDNAINVCDTPLGVRYPLKNQKTFLVNLLSLFGTPIKGDYPMGIDDISSRAIDLAYKKFDKENPKLYSSNVYVDIDEELKKYDLERLGLIMDEETSWWEIVDFLFKQKEYYLASKAQRQASPLLRDIINLFSHSVIEELYGKTTYNGDKLISYFWNACTSASNKYEILTMPTRLDFSESRVVALDLDEVAPKGAGEPERQTAVMYMVGRQLIASKFFLMPSDVASIENDDVREFHLQKINSIRNDPKRLNFDEVHRITKTSGSSAAIKQIVADIETAIRESRKWKLHVGLYSQAIDDIPAEIRNLATSIYIMGAGTNDEIKRLEEIFSLTRAEIDVIKGINKPNARGSSFLALMKTDEGEIRQRLFNTLGSVMLWGFSSTWDDNRVREKLLKAIPPEQAFKLLAKFYPGGSISKEANKRKAEYLDKGLSVDTIEEIADDLIDVYNKNILS